MLLQAWWFVIGKRKQYCVEVCNMSLAIPVTHKLHIRPRQFLTLPGYLLKLCDCEYWIQYQQSTGARILLCTGYTIIITYKQSCIHTSLSYLESRGYYCCSGNAHTWMTSKQSNCFLWAGKNDISSQDYDAKLYKHSEWREMSSTKWNELRHSKIH